MSEEETTIVVAMPADGHSPVTGSTRGRCAVCQQEVWVSPSTREMFGDPVTGEGVVLMCVDHAMGMMVAGDEPPTVMPLTPGQIREIEEHLR